MTADDDLFAVDLAGDAVSHQVFHLRVAFLVAECSPLCLGHHGLGHGVGIMFLQAGGQTEHLRLILPAEGDDLGHFGRCVGQGAGLVEQNGVCHGDRLHKPPAFHQQLMGAGLLHGGEHCDGHGQLQRTGEVHHQHGQRLVHISGQQPDQSGSAQTVGHQTVCQVSGFALSGGFQLL